MAILAFQKPEKVIMVEADDKFGKFEFRPLEPGFGITIGNALRRILLSSLEGYAISSIKIDGVQHEFDVIPGVIDDVTNIILNLKQVRLKHIAGTADEDTIRINVNGKEELKAGDFNDCMSNFEVLNPELVICRMDSSASFNMTLNIIKGRGYLPADMAGFYPVLLLAPLLYLHKSSHGMQQFCLPRRTYARYGKDRYPQRPALLPS